MTAASQPLSDNTLAGASPFGSPGRRLGAYGVDLLIVLIATFVLVAVTGWPSAFYLAVIVVEALYFAGFEGSPLRGSPGKLLVGLRVVSASGQRLSWGRAAARSLAKVTFGRPAFFFCLIRDRPAWHDTLASTAVVYRSRLGAFHGFEASMRRTRRGIGWAIVGAVFAALLALGGSRAAMMSIVVEGNAMAPTLVSGQHVSANRLGYLFQAPARGDVVVIRATSAGAPDRIMIERIIGLPGETVDVGNGAVYINGQPLHEPYELQVPAYRWGPARVPPGHYFVLGDNRNKSFDSSLWTISPWVARSDILAKV